MCFAEWDDRLGWGDTKIRRRKCSLLVAVFKFGEESMDKGGIIPCIVYNVHLGKPVRLRREDSKIPYPPR